MWVKLIILLGTFISLFLVGALGYSMFLKDRAVSPRLTPSPVAAESIPAIITVEGELVCLPHRDREHQTFECAIGLLGTDKRYYALLRQGGPHILDEFVMGQRVRVIGRFLPGTTKPYDTVGTIEAHSIVGLNIE
jgi:hypothetical protein